MESMLPTKTKISFIQSMGLILPYARKKILEQIRSLTFIIFYLLFFQTLVLGIPVAHSMVISAGMGLVIFGLAFFMEGLVLGLMPLGELIGVLLPRKSPLAVIGIFSFLLGLGATFAEPAIGVLREAGRFVLPWQAPLLYMLLNKHADQLVYAVGGGVGFAVFLGTLRFLYNWSLKPFLYSLVGLAATLTAFAYFDPNMLFLSGLAWDTGAVTTGPVTVPLVLALGIGISRISGSGESATAGFGVVTIASLMPILMVLGLGFYYSPSVPDPMMQDSFFSEAKQSQVLPIFQSKSDYEQSKARYQKKEDDTQEVPKKNPGIRSAELVSRNFLAAFRAILPLTFFLLFVLLAIIREGLPRADEMILGIFFSLLGMGLFNTGIELGLTRMGNQVGSYLPSAFRSIEIETEKKKIKDFPLDQVKVAISDRDGVEPFFYLKVGSEYRAVPFFADRLDPDTGSYTHIPRVGPLFGPQNSSTGIFVVILFAFFMGYGATMAEPALNALGIKVEEITVGSFKKSRLMQAVALGVGGGLALGVARLIWDIPLAWMILPSYAVLIPITYFSTEEFVNIGWDSAGVTTGPITVPLVLAMGLGIGGQVSVVEGFGILAMASVGPVLTVLLTGIYTTWKRNRYLSPDESELRRRRRNA